MFILRQAKGSRVMAVECICGEEISFAGVSCPIICTHCNEILPDALNLYSDEGERIEFHLDYEELQRSP